MNNFIYLIVNLFLVTGCSYNTIFSVKHDANNKSFLSYNTGFNRKVILDITSEEQKPPTFNVSTIDECDVLYDLHYEESWFFSDTFDFKVDKNNRLENHHLKAESDVSSILSSALSIAKAAYGVPFAWKSNIQDGKCHFIPSNSLESLPLQNHQFKFQLCKKFDSNHIQSHEYHGITIEVNCANIIDNNDILSQDVIEGLLVYDAKPVTMSIYLNGEWGEDCPQEHKHEKILVATSELVYPSNLHAIPINRNILTSPETTATISSGIFQGYSISKKGIIKGFFDTITEPVKSIFPKITTTDGKSSSTYKSQ